jgi:NhaP-type Na+/H+ or K+/H+ antiporter
MTIITYFILTVFLYGLISGAIQGTIITAPILFAIAGMGAGFALNFHAGGEGGLETFLLTAELGLVLLLFTDASTTSLHVLGDIRNLPIRLLGLGMPLTILAGIAAAMLVFPDLTLWEAGILAAILAPTDAGLGQIIVSSKRVPMNIRQALNVEAGLNDGMAVPFMLFFIALAAGGEAGHESSLGNFIVEQLGYGVAIGLGLGLIGGWCLALAQRKKWMSNSFQHLGVMALPLLCITFSNAVGASMFIAAFVAGLAVQVTFKQVDEHSVEFTERCGHFLNIAVFFLFGLLVARGWSQLTFASVIYGVLSLTVVRMLPVAICLIGTKLSKATVVFMGWFGPRGLASIVLGLVYIEHQTEAGTIPEEITTAVIMTVLLSVFAHGMSAGPGIELLARITGKPDALSERGA